MTFDAPINLVLDEATRLLAAISWQPPGGASSIPVGTIDFLSDDLTSIIGDTPTGIVTYPDAAFVGNPVADLGGTVLNGGQLAGYDDFIFYTTGGGSSSLSILLRVPLGEARPSPASAYWTTVQIEDFGVASADASFSESFDGSYAYFLWDYVAIGLELGVGTHTFAFTFGDPVPDGYAIYRDGLLIGTTTTDDVDDGLSFEDTAVVPGVTYRYTVAAWNAGSEENTSPLSEELVVTIPAQLVHPPVVFADISAAKPRIYEPKENLTVRGRA